MVLAQVALNCFASLIMHVPPLSISNSVALHRRHPYGQVYLSKCGSEGEQLQSQKQMQLRDPSPGDDVRPEAAVEADDATVAVEDDASDLLHRQSREQKSSSRLTLKQRLRVIVGLLRGPLLPSAVAVAGNFGITLALFPGVLTEMRSSNNKLTDWCRSPSTAAVFT
jgi:hypothetical protein